MNRYTIILSTCLIALFSNLANAAPLGTAFTYQGSLNDAGTPVDGLTDMRFSLWDKKGPAATQIGATLEFSSAPGAIGPPINVVQGLFTVELSFGVTPFDGQDVYLEIEVDVPSGNGNWTLLAPRQRVAPTPYALQTRGLYVDPALNVGIGTTLPLEQLHVDGNLRIDGAGNGGQIIVQNADGNDSIYLRGGTSGEGGGMNFYANGNPFMATIVLRGDEFDNGQIDMWNASGDLTTLINSEEGDAYLALGGGSVGVGESLPLAPLHVEGGNIFLTADALNNDDVVIEAPHAALGLYSNPSGVVSSRIHLGRLDATGNLVDKWTMWHRTDGELRFNYGPDASPTSPNNPWVMRLHPDGRTICRVLQIDGGADLAERFPTSESGTIEPGTVMEIDPENAGRLRIARGAYNRRVAGVVSGAGDLPPGAILGNLPGQNDAPPIALSGRVWVRCDATQHAIEPGDLLTTAALPGHAMKVTDHVAAQGAIIGKAMSSLERGEKGLVLVLVSLQ